MREPLISLLLAAFLGLVIFFYGVFIKKNKTVVISKNINYIFFFLFLAIVIYCIITFILVFIKREEIIIWPSNAIFILAIIFFISGMIDIVRKKKTIYYDSFISYFVVFYTLIIIVWRIVGFVIS